MDIGSPRMPKRTKSSGRVVEALLAQVVADSSKHDEAFPSRCHHSREEEINMSSWKKDNHEQEIECDVDECVVNLSATIQQASEQAPTVLQHSSDMDDADEGSVVIHELVLPHSIKSSSRRNHDSSLPGLVSFHSSTVSDASPFLGAGGGEALPDFMDGVSSLESSPQSVKGRKRCSSTAETTSRSAMGASPLTKWSSHSEHQKSRWSASKKASNDSMPSYLKRGN